MLKKAIHYAHRALMRCFELAGILALLVVAGWGGLLVRLSYGPMDINPYFTQKLETALHEQIQGFNFHVDHAQLIWGGQFEPLEVQLSNVSITRADNTPVLSVARLGVQLSKRALVFGQLVPRLVRVYSPMLRVIRLADGGFTLNIGAEDAPPPAPETVPAALPPAPDAVPEAPRQSEAARAQFLHDVLLQLRVRQGLGVLDGLRQIDVQDAVVVYEDRVLNVVWRSSGASVILARGKRGIVSTAIVALDMGQGDKAALHADIAYRWETQETQATIAFSGVNPARIAQKSAPLKKMAGVDLPLSGSARFRLDKNFRPSDIRLVLGAEAGAVGLPGIYDKPLPVKSFYMSGDFNARDWTGSINQLRADLDGPSVDMTATIAPDAAAGSTAKIVRVQGELNGMPMDSLSRYWPESLAPNPRQWVTRHLSKGIATRATLDMTAAWDAAAEPPVTVRKLGGKIVFKNITVDYLPPLQPVTGATGTADYDMTSFNLDIAGGALKDMPISKSVIHITDLHHANSPTEHAHIDIDVDLKGPLKTALAVLDSEPLGYPEKLGIQTADVAGDADVNVSFKFPLHKKLTMEEVQVAAKARLNDVMLKEMVAGMTLTGGPMDLTVDNHALKVGGDGRLGGMPVHFDWQKNFAKTDAVQSALKAKLALTPAALLAFGAPEGYGLTGSLPSDVSYILKADNTATLALKGDLTPFGFSVPALPFQKEAGDAGGLSFTLGLKDGKAQGMTDIDLQTAGLNLAGAVDFSGGASAIRKAALTKLQFGKSDVALTAENKGKDGWSLTVKGAQLDASSVFAAGQKNNSDAEAEKPVTPLHVFLDVGRLLTGPDRALTQVKAVLDRNGWQRLDRLDVDALAGGKVLALRYDPAGAGHGLKLQANDAGAALSVLGITNSIRGGVLSVTGTPQKTGPRDLSGSAMLTGFTLKDAPVVAKLLNAMSLSGMISLLGGEGMSFKKARVNYFWTDRGQPGQQKNVRLLRLKDGETSGASLGLTFEGNIDQWENTYDLNGTIIPVSDLNKLLNIIPIVGTVLTAGGEGVIAATYTLTGPKDAPVVSVNPLAALAPGILRKLFFEK
jgi:hypothetical protein